MKVESDGGSGLVAECDGVDEILLACKFVG